MIPKITNLYYQMLRIRRIEEAIADAYKDQEIRTPVHLSIGQEAIAVGVCANLKPSDKVFSGHRAHAHFLDKGGNLKAFMAELYGKEWGLSQGRSGSMHLQDLSCGFQGSSSIVGGTIPLAVGSAWADKIKGNKDVTVVFFGDGAFEEGVIHEAFNFAVLHQIPIVFVCENNKTAVNCDISERQSYKREIVYIAEAHGLEADSGTGQNLRWVVKMSQVAIDRARQGYPQFLEFYTERERVHCGIGKERDLLNDPLKIHSYTYGEILEMEKEIQLEIEEAFEFAKKSPVPTNSERGVYAS